MVSTTRSLQSALSATALFSLVLLPAQVHSSTFLTNTLECGIVAVETGTFPVCAIGSGTGPSPADLGNGTTVYLGGYSDTFQIAAAGAYEEGTDLPSDFSPVITVTASRDDADVCQISVSFNGTEAVDCSSCTYCEGLSFYSADCTNIEYGREVTCEGSDLTAGLIFFPLTAESLGLTAVAPSNMTDPSPGSPSPAPADDTEGGPTDSSGTPGEGAPTDGAATPPAAPTPATTTTSNATNRAMSMAAILFGTAAVLML